MIRIETTHRCQSLACLSVASLILLCVDLTVANGQTAERKQATPATEQSEASPLAPPSTSPDPEEPADPAVVGQSGAADFHVSGLEPPASGLSLSPPSGDDDAYKLEPGNRLKISIYGRDDLTAEYRVNDRGQVRIPTLGVFDAAGRLPAQLEAAVRQAFERVLMHPGNVAVDVIERQPIFVTGLVAKPGAYRFSSGMAVIHATTLAGGTTSSAAVFPTEALRERSHIRGAKEEMKHLIARQARLVAERDGKDDIAIPPDLEKLVGRERAAQVIDDEKDALKRQRDLMEREKTALEASIKENKIELAAFEMELTNIGEQRRLRQATLDRIQVLSEKGLTTQQHMTDTRILLTSVDRDAQYAIANIARSRQNLERAERDLAVLWLERRVTISKELQTIEEQLEKQREIIDVANRVIDRIAGLPSALLTEDHEPEFRFEVMRKSGDDELHVIAATETTKLHPGDVLRVSAKRVGE